MREEIEARHEEDSDNAAVGVGLDGLASFLEEDLRRVARVGARCLLSVATSASLDELLRLGEESAQDGRGERETRADEEDESPVVTWVDEVEVDQRSDEVADRVALCAMLVARARCTHAAGCHCRGHELAQGRSRGRWMR